MQHRKQGCKSTRGPKQRARMKDGWAWSGLALLCRTAPYIPGHQDLAVVARVGNRKQVLRCQLQPESKSTTACSKS
eukprot:6486875-Amphidinium_carterae.1